MKGVAPFNENSSKVVPNFRAEGWMQLLAGAVEETADTPIQSHGRTRIKGTAIEKNKLFLLSIYEIAQQHASDA
jgi:hypothetical protein